MGFQQQPSDYAVGVGAVGLHPGTEEGLLAELPQGRLFQLVAFSDEGMEEPLPAGEELTYYSDYNLLLRDPAVELVLVGGPLELRRDMAVRALSADRHVVCELPFCETALGGERILKEALRRELVATANLTGRDDPDLLALRQALRQENVGSVQGIFYFLPVAPPERLPRRGPGLLKQQGMEVLDLLNLVATDDVANVTAHLQRRVPALPETGFCLYLPLRNQGWAVAQVEWRAPVGLPRWVVHTPGVTFTAADGVATAATPEAERSYGPPAEGEEFWANLYATIREGAELKCHPAQIVRAMKLHEAALESAELAEPITI